MVDTEVFTLLADVLEELEAVEMAVGDTVALLLVAAEVAVAPVVAPVVAALVVAALVVVEPVVLTAVGVVVLGVEPVVLAVLDTTGAPAITLAGHGHGLQGQEMLSTMSGTTSCSLPSTDWTKQEHPRINKRPRSLIIFFGRLHTTVI